MPSISTRAVLLVDWPSRPALPVFAGPGVGVPVPVPGAAMVRLRPGGGTNWPLWKVMVWFVR